MTDIDIYIKLATLAETTFVLTSFVYQPKYKY